MNWTDLISSILGLTCVVLAGRQSKYNFWVGYLYNIFLFLLFWNQHLVAAMMLQPVAFIINAFGHWRWTHPRPEETSSEDGKSLAVSSMNPRQWGIAAAVVLFCGAVLSIILREETADPSPWLDLPGAVPFCPEEMGMLDCVDRGQPGQPRAIHGRRLEVHACGQHTVSCQWRVVARQLVKNVWK